MAEDNSVEWVGLVPLLGFRMPIDRIELSPGVCIRVMQPDERKRCQRLGACPRRKDPSTAFAIHMVESARNPSGHPEEYRRDAADFSRRAIEKTLHILWALRLFGEGRFCATRLVYQRSDAAKHIGAGCSYFGQPQQNPRGYDLILTEGNAFGEYWLKVQSGLSSPSLQFALDRFSEALTREQPEDGFVDLMIATEAMFLSGERDELRYRMAQRFAVLMEPDPSRRHTAFREMGGFYDVRSWIVHGKTTKQPTAAKVKEVTDLENRLEELIRAALNKAVLAAGTTQPWPPDWDQLVLAGSVTPTNV